MGAKFNIQIIGHKIYDSNLLIELLESLAAIIKKTVGNLNIASLQDLKTGKIEDYYYIDLPSIINCLTEENKIIFLYSDDFKKGSLSMMYEGNYWELCLSLNSNYYSYKAIEEMMLNIWELIKSYNPIFIIAGEELELTYNDILSVDNNEKTILDIPLCELAIINGNIIRSSP
jgi:hypothetical protein